MDVEFLVLAVGGYQWQFQDLMNAFRHSTFSQAVEYLAIDFISRGAISLAAPADRMPVASDDLNNGFPCSMPHHMRGSLVVANEPQGGDHGALATIVWPAQDVQAFRQFKDGMGVRHEIDQLDSLDH